MPTPTNPMSRAVFRHAGFLESYVVRAAGISSQRLNYLVERALLILTEGGQGRGSRRLYSPEDVVVLAVVNRLLDLGLTPKRAVAIGEKVRAWISHEPQVSHFLGDEFRKLPLARLVVAADAEDGEIEAPPKATTPAAAITLDISALAADVVARLYRR